MDRSVYQRMAQLEDRHWWFRARRQIVRTLIGRILGGRSDVDILEVGCGTGGNIGLLREFGRVDALEYDSAARQIAEAKSGAVVRRCALPHEIDAPEDKYELVLLLDVLEHIEEDVASLDAVRRKLAPGGHLILTVPALPWLWSRHDVAHHHFRRYTATSLRRAAEAGGFTVRQIGYFNTLLFPILVTARLLKRATGRDTPDDAMPGQAVNAALRWLFGLEHFVIGRVPLPVGSSLFLVAQRT